MEDRFVRTKMLLGNEAIEKLQSKRVAVFGIGGVGGYVCEALVRSGIGHFDLIDNDTVALSNLNRQIIATKKTLGRYKTDVMKERMLDINPSVEVRIHNCFFLPENADEFDFGEYDYVVDAVDTVTAKIAIIMKAKDAGVPVISSMGTGNKLDPGRLKIADISKTSVCPLARVMRRELNKRGINSLKVVFSDEPPIKPVNMDGSDDLEVSSDSDDSLEIGVSSDAGMSRRRSTPGSTAFVPASAGLMIASEVVRDLSGV